MSVIVAASLTAVSHSGVANAASAAWSVSNHSSDSAVVVVLVRWAALPDRDLVPAIWLLGPSCVASARTRFGLNLVRARSAQAGGC
jgi:hypothetical protein